MDDIFSLKLQSVKTPCQAKSDVSSRVSLSKTISTTVRYKYSGILSAHDGTSCTYSLAWHTASFGYTFAPLVK